MQSNNNKLRTLLLGVGNGMSNAILTEIKEVEKNVALFKIAIQRAEQFYSEEFPAVIVGDAAVTPHPEAGSGIGAGFKGFEELKVLFASLKESDRSDNNEGAFKTFNDAYELHVSRKALEGTRFVLTNLIKMVTAFCDEGTANLNQIVNPQANAIAKKQVDQAEELKKDLEEEKVECKHFEALLTNKAEVAVDANEELDAMGALNARGALHAKGPFDKHKPLLYWDARMDRSVGQLWDSIGITYHQIKELTGSCELLGNRLDKIESMLKFDAQKAVA